MESVGYTTPAIIESGADPALMDYIATHLAKAAGVLKG